VDLKSLHHTQFMRHRFPKNELHMPEIFYLEIADILGKVAG